MATRVVVIAVTRSRAMTVTVATVTLETCLPTTHAVSMRPSSGAPHTNIHVEPFHSLPIVQSSGPLAGPSHAPGELSQSGQLSEPLPRLRSEHETSWYAPIIPIVMSVQLEVHKCFRAHGRDGRT